MTKEIKLTLAAARVNKGMSQRYAAELCGISRELLQKIEEGKSDPRYSVVKKMSDIYEIDMDSLIVPEKSA